MAIPLVPWFDICITCNKNKSIARFPRILVPPEYPSKLNFLTADFYNSLPIRLDFHHTNLPYISESTSRDLVSGEIFSTLAFSS